MATYESLIAQFGNPERQSALEVNFTYGFKARLLLTAKFNDTISNSDQTRTAPLLFPCSRNWLGDAPMMRLKARLKDASDS